MGNEKRAVVEAVLVGSYDALLDALAAGGDPNESDGSTSALAFAVLDQRSDLVDALLRYGASMDHQTDHGSTVLHTAASIGNCAVIELLVERGADIECRTSIGQTPLMRAAHSGVEKGVRFLIERGACVLQTDNRGLTALHWSIIGGDHVEVAKALIDAGANARIANHDGETPLQYAQRYSRSDLLDYFQSITNGDAVQLQ